MMQLMLQNLQMIEHLAVLLKLRFVQLMLLVELLKHHSEMCSLLVVIFVLFD